jgi:hypothetical protein
MLQAVPVIESDVLAPVMSHCHSVSGYWVLATQQANCSALLRLWAMHSGKWAVSASARSAQAAPLSPLFTLGVGWHSNCTRTVV